MAELSFTGMLALYALTGVFAGSSMRMGRIGIALGGIAPSIFFFFYDATLPLDIVYFFHCYGDTFISFDKPHCFREIAGAFLSETRRSPVEAAGMADE